MSVSVILLIIAFDKRLTSYKQLVFFGHLTPAVEELRYQHLYHPIDVRTTCPALANVLDQISAGLFGDSGVYEPYVSE